MAMRHIAVAAMAAGLMVGLAGVRPAGAGVVVEVQAAGEAPAAGAPVNLGPYQGLAEAVGLSEDQQKKLAEQYAKMQEAQRRFLEANQKAWAGAMEKASDADPKAAAEGKAMVAKLQAQYDQLTAAEHARVMAILTKEQAMKWDQQQLQSQVIAAIFPVQVGHGPEGMMARREPLTEQQTGIVTKACAEMARTIQGWPNPYDAAKRKEAVAKLIDQVRQELLKANALPVAPDEK